jgi:hypothetical protein
MVETNKTNINKIYYKKKSRDEKVVTWNEELQLGFVKA